MNILLKIATVVALPILSACSAKPSLEHPSLSTRDFDLEKFFEGHSVARGQFQDVFGKVQRRFEVDINGTWDGETLRLVEDFSYDDGSTEQRIWSLQKTGPESWVGTAPGVIGQAVGQEKGDTFNWAYEIDLPVRKGTMRVKFDDWMWLLDDDRLLNQAYMKRFGLDVGQVTLIFEKK